MADEEEQAKPRSRSQRRRIEITEAEASDAGAGGEPAETDPASEVGAGDEARSGGNGEGGRSAASGERAAASSGAAAGEVDPVADSRGSGSRDGLSDPAMRSLLKMLAPNERNPFVGGTLTVHYASRDVDFPVDGATALRALATLAGESNDRDAIAGDADARSIWLMIDRSGVIGAQWTPAGMTIPRRVTFDPTTLVDTTRASS